MKKSLIVLLVCIVIVANGCSSLNGTVQALANDPAEIDIVINSPYGQQTFHRRMPTNWQNVVYITNTVVVPAIAK